jgi:hypothetical protein
MEAVSLTLWIQPGVRAHGTQQERFQPLTCIAEAVENLLAPPAFSTAKAAVLMKS